MCIVCVWCGLERAVYCNTVSNSNTANFSLFFRDLVAEKCLFCGRTRDNISYPSEFCLFLIKTWPRLGLSMCLLCWFCLGSSRVEITFTDSSGENRSYLKKASIDVNKRGL